MQTPQNQSLAWDQSSPDLTPCFQETVLVWIPCAFLWLLAPYEVYHIRSSVLKTRSRLPWTLVSGMKIVFALLLVLASALEAAKALAALAYGKTPSDPVHYYTPIIKLVTFILALVLMSLHRKKAINSSAVLFMFWLLFSLSSGFSYYSLLKDLLDSVCAHAQQLP